MLTGVKQKQNLLLWDWKYYLSGSGWRLRQQWRIGWVLEDVWRWRFGGAGGMRWWHHLWHTPLSCQWGGRSEAFGILSPDLSLVVPHIPLSSCSSLFLCFLPQCSHQRRFSACSTWQHITLCPSLLPHCGLMNQTQETHSTGCSQ